MNSKDKKAMVEVLKAARELISTPERWTKGKYSKPMDGVYGLCYCSLGAIYASGDAINNLKSTFEPGSWA